MNVLFYILCQSSDFCILFALAEKLRYILSGGFFVFLFYLKFDSLYYFGKVVKSRLSFNFCIFQNKCRFNLGELKKVKQVCFMHFSNIIIFNTALVAFFPHGINLVSNNLCIRHFTVYLLTSWCKESNYTVNILTKT